MHQPSARILIIEDDSSISEFMALALDLEGYEVKTVGNGADALALLAAWEPDLITCDLMMPVMDGLQFLEAYHQCPGAHAPTIVYTAAHGQSLSLPLERGAAAVYSKPFDIEELLQAVADHLPIRQGLISVV